MSVLSAWDVPSRLGQNEDGCLLEVYGLGVECATRKGSHFVSASKIDV